MFCLPKFMLSGMSGMAFRFVIHKRLLPSSLDMYNWAPENWKAVDNLGIYSEVYEGTHLNTTFPLYRNEAIRKISESIDNGMPVITWGLNFSEFCLITGYDDSDGVLYYMHPGDTENNVLIKPICLSNQT
jgi:hypothetical protein